MSFYICANCGFGSASWIGKCPDCNEWNTLKEHRDDEPDKKSKRELKEFTVQKFTEVKSSKKQRRSTGIFEFDRVLGGGIVPGEVILLTGEPGIGKSTLLLQALRQQQTIYVSGEESAEQVKDRAQRLKIPLTNIRFSDVLQIESIIKGIGELSGTIDLLVVDSIQTVYSREVESTAGTVNQLKESTQKLVQFAKRSGVPVIIVGHVTKDGDIAGPKMLEHLVDCVLLFEGEKISHHRVLRAQKNRFGTVDEIGIFEMQEAGLTEVDNPLAFLDSPQTEIVPGKAIVGVAEGKRPLFFEVQALTVPTTLSIPRRVANGIEYNKLLLLLAVVRRHLNLSLDTVDIYVNIIGGIQIKSPAIDLGVISAIVSSLTNQPIPKKAAFLGEVGLLGEVRQVYFQDRIIQEATRLKFTTIVSPKTIKNVKELRKILAPHV